MKDILMCEVANATSFNMVLCQDLAQNKMSGIAS